MTKNQSWLFLYFLGVDINTQQSFEALSERAVAVVVDPIQSVKGKVSIIMTSVIFLSSDNIYLDILIFILCSQETCVSINAEFKHRSSRKFDFDL